MKFASVSLLLIVALCVLCQSNSNINATLSKKKFQDNEKTATGSLRLSVRDSMTGLPVRPKITYVNSNDGIASPLSNLSNLSNIATGDNQYQLSRGRYDFEIAATGYRNLKTHFVADPQTALNVTVWVDPEEPLRSFVPKLSERS